MDLEFSKTRIVYYNNLPNTLNSTNWTDKIKVRKANTKDANKCIRIGTVEGATHGWHFIPTNNWGLYTTYNEFVSLIENSSHVQPIGFDVSVSHAIPLAKYPGTANTTQLSFNNTIYSLIYDLMDTDYVRAPTPYNDKNNYIDFIKSYDGSSWKDSSRVTLPNPDIQFKIPYAQDTESDENNNVDAQTRLVTTNVVVDNSGTFSTDDGNKSVPLSDLKLVYFPEFLQDNENTKVLFPGENIDRYSFSDPDNRYAGFSTDGIMAGEHFANLDLRNYYMNSTSIPHDPAYVLTADIFPVLRGPTDYNDNFGICWPDDWNTLDTEMTRSNLETVAALSTGYKYNNQYTTAVPQKFIKGIPLIDPDNNIINHQFCVLLTHTLKVKLTPRTPHIPRPLQWDHVYPIRERYMLKIPGTSPGLDQYSQKTRTTFKRIFPLKPMKPQLYTAPTRRLRANNILSHTKIDDINNTQVDQDLNVTNLEESRSTDWTVTCGINLPTRTFLPSGKYPTVRTKKK